MTTADSEGRGGRFAVVIPLYNHADRVAGVVEGARRLRMPIVVVDDGSTDGSLGRVDAMDGIEVLRHDRNLGKGAALLTGMRHAAAFADWAVTLDADGQHTPADANHLMDALADGRRSIVVGVRQGMDAAEVHWTSRFGRQFSNFWVWASSGRWIPDTQTGFRIYPLPETLQLDVKARRYQFEVEVLVKASWQHIPVKAAPVGVDYRPGARRISHFRPFVDFMRNSKTFGRLILQRCLLPRAWRRF